VPAIFLSYEITRIIFALNFAPGRVGDWTPSRPGFVWEGPMILRRVDTLALSDAVTNNSWNR